MERQATVVREPAVARAQRSYPMVNLGPPLAPSPERLLLQSEAFQLEGRKPVGFNCVEGLRLLGPLDIRALERSLDQLIARHVTLRTAAGPAPGFSPEERRRAIHSFARTASIPVGLYAQAVRDRLSGELRIRDLRALPAPHRDRQLSELFADEGATPFDLEQPPLIRLQVAACAPNDHVVVLTVAHFAADAASMAVLWRDLFAAYACASGARLDPLSPPSFDFHAFVAEQRARYVRGEFDAALAYWDGVWASLAGSPVATTDLDFARPGSFSVTVGWRCDNLHLDRMCSSQIRGVARSLRATPAAVFLAGLAVLLARRTGKSTIAPSVPFANRLRPGTEDMVGWFVNSHPVACHVADNVTARDLLARCRTGLYQALRYQEASAQLLWQQGMRHQPGGTAMIFNLLRTTEPPRLPGLSVERLPPSIAATPTPGSGFDVRVIDDGVCFRVHVMHAAGRFERCTIPLALEQYRRVVTGLVRHLDAPLAGLG